jgi:hypothetical protein
MDTAKELIEYLQTLDPNEAIAVPIIWTKETFEESFERQITKDQWVALSANYLLGDDLYDASLCQMQDAIENILPVIEEND